MLAVLRYARREVAALSRPLARVGPGVAYPSHEELAEYAKRVVDSLPLLADEQRDMLR